MKPLVYIKQGLLNQVASLFTDKEVFNHYKGVVSRLEAKDLTGAQKKALAITELEELGVTILGWVGNLILELAVAYIKTAV